MKRPLILSLAIIFTMSAFTAASSFSYAAYYNNTVTYDYNGFEETVYGEDYEAPAEKDTSWFDYENPRNLYEIYNEEDLMGLASLVNESQIERWKPTRIENFKDTTFVLKNDIELTAKWKPIGTGSASYFAGTFDGNDHTISGLDVELGSGYAGLFGYLVGEVKDLTVEGKVKSKSGTCGGIVGLLDKKGIVKKCVADVSVSGKSKTGGIVGYNNGGTIESCMNLGKVSGTYKVGGIVGENWAGDVSESANYGKIVSSTRGVATYGTGGIAGRSVSSDAVIERSYNRGNVVSATEATGGVVGYTNAAGSKIIDCYNNGVIKVKNDKKSKKIAKAYSGGVVGIVGTNGVIVRNCYNSESVKGADISGGVIGRYNNETDIPQTIEYMKNNYYINGKSDTGIGYLENENDRKISGAAIGVSIESLKTLTGSLAAAYKSDTGIYGNSGYPILKWQEPISEDQKIYMKEIPEDIQKDLDSFLIKNAGQTQYGQCIINFFTPDNYTNDTMLQYSEKKEDKN